MCNSRVEMEHAQFKLDRASKQFFEETGDKAASEELTFCFNLWQVVHSTWTSMT